MFDSSGKPVPQEGKDVVDSPVPHKRSKAGPPSKACPPTKVLKMTECDSESESDTVYPPSTPCSSFSINSDSVDMSDMSVDLVKTFFINFIERYLNALMFTK